MFANIISHLAGDLPAGNVCEQIHKFINLRPTPNRGGHKSTQSWELCVCTFVCVLLVIPAHPVSETQDDLDIPTYVPMGVSVSFALV